MTDYTIVSAKDLAALIHALHHFPGTCRADEQWIAVGSPFFFEKQADELWHQAVMQLEAE